jgi:RHS repeat-associated protein
VSYVRDPGGQLIGIRVGTSTQATRYYFTFDGLGSITGLTDSTGARVNTYRYDPYGQLLSSNETLPQPFRYTGGIHDNATGLTKLGIRYYDPALGRFTQPDPTGQDPHYTYAFNSPVTYRDPSGADTGDDLQTASTVTGALAFGLSFTPLAPASTVLGLASITLSSAAAGYKCKKGDGCARSVAGTAISALTFGQGAAANELGMKGAARAFGATGVGADLLGYLDR